MNQTNKTTHNDYIFYIIIAGMCMAKWLLILPQEIVMHEYDGTAYVQTAENLGRGLPGMSFGYSLWIYITHFTGIPGRLCIELLWLFASFFFALTIRQNTKETITPSTFALALIFYPNILYYFQHPLTEGLTAALALIYATLTTRLFTNENCKITAFFLGTTGGLWAIVRSESVIILPALFATAVLYFTFLLCTKSKNTFQKSTQIAALLFLPFFIPSVVLCSYNYIKFGIYAKWYTDIPALSTTLTKLASIDTGKTNPQYISITRDALQKAYTVSPTLQEMRSTLEERHIFTEQALNQENEIGTGWIYWELLRGASKKHPYNIVAKNNMLHQISNELSVAFENNKLPSKFVLHWTIGDPRAWLPKVSEHLAYAISAVKHVHGKPLGRGKSQEPASYDKMFNRRAYYTSQTLKISGWMYSRHGLLPITKIEAVAQDNGEIYDENKILTGTEHPRPDVDKGLGLINPSTGFSYTARLNSAARPALRLYAQDRLLKEIPPAEVLPGKIFSMQIDNDELGFTIDTATILPASETHAGWRMLVGDRLVKWGGNGWLWLLLIFSGLLALIRTIWRIWKKHAQAGETSLGYAALSLTATALFSFSFYTFFTLVAWKDNSRYFIPTGVLIVGACFVSLAALARSYTDAKRSQDGVTPAR